MSCKISRMINLILQLWKKYKEICVWEESIQPRPPHTIVYVHVYVNYICNLYSYFYCITKLYVYVYVFIPCICNLYLISFLILQQRKYFSFPSAYSEILQQIIIYIYNTNFNKLSNFSI